MQNCTSIEAFRNDLVKLMQDYGYTIKEDIGIRDEMGGYGYKLMRNEDSYDIYNESGTEKIRI